jgi:hypothetical protein
MVDRLDGAYEVYENNYCSNNGRSKKPLCAMINTGLKKCRLDCPRFTLLGLDTVDWSRRTYVSAKVLVRPLNQYMIIADSLVVPRALLHMILHRNNQQLKLERFVDNTFSCGNKQEPQYLDLHQQRHFQY